MFEVMNVLWGSNVSRGVPEIECSRMSCSDVFESDLMCYLLADSTTTSICALSKKNWNVSVKKFLVFEVTNVFGWSNISQGKPEIESSRVSCFDVFESYSMCYLFTDSSTTSILSLTDKWLSTPDKVSIHTSPVNNSSVIWKLFRKWLVFSSNSCIHLLLDKRVLGAMPTMTEECASHNKGLLMFSIQEMSQRCLSNGK